MKTFSLVAEKQFPTFETIDELLRDQRTKFSMLAGQVTLDPMFVSLLNDLYLCPHIDCK